MVFIFCMQIFAVNHWNGQRCSLQWLRLIIGVVKADHSNGKLCGCLNVWVCSKEKERGNRGICIRFDF